VLAWTEAAIRRNIPEFKDPYRHHDWQKVLASTGDFLFIGKDSHRHNVVMSSHRYLNLWRSHNRLNSIAGPTRFNQFWLELKDYLAINHIKQLHVPYICEAWSARRR
jgi:hypothetical protein